MGAFNGSGLFVRTYKWVTDKINGIDITASRQDTEDDGFAAGLSLCTTRDGQGKMAANWNPSADASYDMGAPSAQWRNAYLSGTLTHKDSIQTSGRIIKTAQQTITGSNTPTADSALVMTPVSVGSYLIEARMAFTANGTSGPNGIKVGLFANNINFDSGLVNAFGLVNAAQVISATGSIGAVFAFATASSVGTGANWVILKGSIRILNLTGTPLIGVNWSQNTSGGPLTAETGCYLEMTRVS